jgi:lipoate-protein ligase A
VSVPWSVERHAGTAAGFHGRDLVVDARRAVWWFEVEGPAVALGSTQSPEVVDAAAAARLGVEVVRRRSGGGAVWLAPGDVTWVDVVLPAGEPEWIDDVGRAAAWLGAAWAEALAAVGVPGAEVHAGPMVRTPWSDLVCFAGLAPGEVTIDGCKVVGISQRRTRLAARFQCAVLHSWDPSSLLAVLKLGADQRTWAAGELVDAGVGVGAVAPADLVAALVVALGGPAAPSA